MNLVAFNDEHHGLRLDALAKHRQGELLVRFQLTGPLDALVWPSPALKPQRRDGLWEHTCFEVFLSQEGANEYREWNLSPSGDWASYAFKAYRERLNEADSLSSPRFSSKREGDEFILEASLPLAKTSQTSSSIIGLTAVLEHAGGKKTYWALHHAGTKPDFHDSASFILKVPD